MVRAQFLHVRDQKNTQEGQKECFALVKPRYLEAVSFRATPPLKWHRSDRERVERSQTINDS